MFSQSFFSVGAIPGFDDDIARVHEAFVHKHCVSNSCKRGPRFEQGMLTLLFDREVVLAMILRVDRCFINCSRLVLMHERGFEGPALIWRNLNTWENMSSELLLKATCSIRIMDKGVTFMWHWQQ